MRVSRIIDYKVVVYDSATGITEEQMQYLKYFSEEGYYLNDLRIARLERELDEEKK